MCGGGSKKEEAATPEAAPISPIAQSMIDMASAGPTGYSDHVRKNLGMDVRNRGYQGGKYPRSKMTRGKLPFGAKQQAPKANPLLDLLAPPMPVTEPPKTPMTTPTTPPIVPEDQTKFLGDMTWQQWRDDMDGRGR